MLVLVRSLVVYVSGIMKGNKTLKHTNASVFMRGSKSTGGQIINCLRWFSLIRPNFHPGQV